MIDRGLVEAPKKLVRWDGGGTKEIGEVGWWVILPKEGKWIRLWSKRLCAYFFGDETKRETAYYDRKVIFVRS